MSLPGTNTHCPSSPSHELLITIGPQCAGKTSYLANYSKENNEKVVDISMDDIDRTYERISVPMILEYQETGQYDLDWERNVYRQSILMRINEILCTEQLPLVLLFKEEISMDEFHAHMLTLEKISEDDRQIILETAQRLYDDGHRLITPTIDLFIRDAMGYSVQQAQTGLFNACRTNHKVVAWGNTNLAPNMYKFALQQAFETNRRVKFVKWGHELPSITLSDLQSRNILRYLRTGRYINLSVVRDFLKRTELFFSRLEFQEGEEIDVILARLAGFRLQQDGNVIPIPQTPDKRVQSSSYQSQVGSSESFRQESGDRVEGRGYRASGRGRDFRAGSHRSSTGSSNRESPNSGRVFSVRSGR